MRPRLPSELTTRALHAFVLTVVSPCVGIGLVVYLAAVAASKEPLAYAAASSLILGALKKPREDDESDS